MENKKVIFLIQTLEAAGGERVVSDLSLNLPDNIERVIVLFQRKISFPYKGKLMCLDVSLSQKFFLKFYNLAVAFFRLKKIIASEKPDYVISFGNTPNIFNLLLKKGPIIRIETRVIKRKDFFGAAHDLLLKILIGRAEKIIVVSRGLKNSLVKHFNIKEDKIELIYNPVNIEEIKRLSGEEIGPEYKNIFENPAIINIGRLTKEKGQGCLIKAFKEAKKKINNLKLVIIGEGVLENYLKGLAKELGLEKDVYFLGRQANPFKFIAQSRLFVSSSLWEGFGLAILEAMACGLPVISSDCQGPKEILEEGKCGVLVPAGDEIKMSEEIVKLLSDKNMQGSLRMRAYERIKDFDIDNIIREYNFLNNK